MACAHNGSTADVTYPAKYAADYDNVICVSATDSYDRYSQWSNYGSAVTVSAPGGALTTPAQDPEEMILSTWPQYLFSALSLESLQLELGDQYTTRLRYSYVDGTSFATPIVSGIAGLILSRWPTKTPAQVREIIEKSAEDLGDEGWDAHYGHGRVNAGYAIAAPDAPKNFSITGGEMDHPTLHWSPPDAPDIKRYRVKRTIDSSNEYFWINAPAISWTDSEICIEQSAPTAVYYRIQSMDYTTQYSPYTGAVSTHTGIIPMGQGGGAEVALFESSMPEAFQIGNATPNPFNAQTVIRVGLPVSMRVKLDIYDVLGRKVSTLLEDHISVGWHNLTWDASKVPSGTYFLIGRSNHGVQTKRLTVIK